MAALALCHITCTLLQLKQTETAIDTKPRIYRVTGYFKLADLWN